MNSPSPTPVKDHILQLARQNAVVFKSTPIDIFAQIITNLSDDDVVFDNVENTLVALERAGVIEREQVVPLHMAYLHEKFKK